MKSAGSFRPRAILCRRVPAACATGLTAWTASSQMAAATAFWRFTSALRSSGVILGPAKEAGAGDCPPATTAPVLLARGAAAVAAGAPGCIGHCEGSSGAVATFLSIPAEVSTGVLGALTRGTPIVSPPASGDAARNCACADAPAAGVSAEGVSGHSAAAARCAPLGAPNKAAPSVSRPGVGVPWTEPPATVAGTSWRPSGSTPRPGAGPAWSRSCVDDDSLPALSDSHIMTPRERTAAATTTVRAFRRPRGGRIGRERRCIGSPMARMLPGGGRRHPLRCAVTRAFPRAADSQDSRTQMRPTTARGHLVAPLWQHPRGRTLS